MSDVKSCRLNVAICGGGIGGLTLATFILKYANDIRVDLYEAGPRFTEIGAGISVWKRTWRLMQILGLDERLGKMAVTPPEEKPRDSFVFRKSDTEEGFNFYRVVVPYGSITLHRADALKVLTDDLPQGLYAHFSKRLVNYHVKDNSVVLQFSDGAEAPADLLVGADGVGSVTRAVMYRQLSKERTVTDPAESKRLAGFIHPTWTGTYAYRHLIDPNRLLAKSFSHQAATLPMIYFGKKKHIVSYPISQGKLINLVAFVTVADGEGKPLTGPTVEDVLKQELVDHFKGWEQEVQDLLDCCDKPSRWAISHIRGLPYYASGRVAILGDAAHAMTTHFGAGAGQAIEDAHILGRLLSDKLVTKDSISIALQVYQDIRQPFASNVVEKSRETGFLYEFNAPGYEVCEDEQSLRGLSEKIFENWSWQWKLNVEEDWTLAQATLKDEFKRLRH